jgi:hypothetical protein
MSFATPRNVDDFDWFLASITQKSGDPTFSILKGHLLFEELLRAHVAKRLPNAAALDGARLTFAQLLAVARACAFPPISDHGIWAAIARLNKLRNDLAHHLEPKEEAAAIQGFIDLVLAALGEVSLPASDAHSPMPSETGEPYVGPLYSNLDMAMAGLFGAGLGLLRLGAREVERAPASPPGGK